MLFPANLLDNTKNTKPEPAEVTTKKYTVKLGQKQITKSTDKKTSTYQKQFWQQHKINT